jgi:hypothetical protein
LQKEQAKIAQQRTNLLAQENQIRAQIIAVEGAVSENKYWLKNWVV